MDKADDLITRLGYPEPVRGWAKSTTDVRDKLRDLLTTVKDGATPIDSGGGVGGTHLWVTIGGVEYFIEIKRSNGQRLLDKETALAQAKAE